MDSRSDAIGLRNFLLIINIHFDKGKATRLAFRAGKLFEERGNGFAGPAPVGIEVGDQVGVG